jgi:hypothetical protein
MYISLLAGWLRIHNSNNSRKILNDNDHDDDDEDADVDHAMIMNKVT